MYYYLPNYYIIFKKIIDKKGKERFKIYDYDYNYYNKTREVYAYTTLGYEFKYLKVTLRPLHIADLLKCNKDGILKFFYYKSVNKQYINEFLERLTINGF